METNDIVMLVLAEHIVEKLSTMCSTLVLLQKPQARIHIANVDTATSDSAGTYESTIRWNQALDDVLIAKGKLLCELTRCSADNLYKRMADIIDTQYRELVAALMVVMMQEELTNYHIKMEPGRITVDLKLSDSAYTAPTIK